MISYYFGNKAGLVAAVVDSVVHDEYIVSQNRMKDVPAAQRVQRLVEEMRNMDAATAEFRAFFELLPHVLRDEALRQRIALLYRWYWSVKLEWLGVADPYAARKIEISEALPACSRPSSTGSPCRRRSRPTSTSRTPTASSRNSFATRSFILPNGSLVGGEPGSPSA